MSTLETSPIADDAAGAHSLHRLVRRFKRMAQCRDEDATAQRAAGNIHIALNMECGAAAYERCAEELMRVLSGEQPPEECGYWPQSPNDQRCRNLPTNSENVCQPMKQSYEYCPRVSNRD